MNYSKLLRISLTIFFALSFCISPLSAAEKNKCYLMAPLQDDAWVIVYSATIDGERGEVIWEGKIKAKDKKKIISATGYIRYEFKREIDQPYEGEFSRMCSGGHTISL